MKTNLEIPIAPIAESFAYSEARALTDADIAAIFDDAVRDPSLDVDGTTVHVDANCPACGWPERAIDTLTRRFGCVRCPYRSDERND